MSILDYFDTEGSVSAEITRDSVLFVDGVQQPPTPASIVTLDVIFYVGTQAETLVAEKIRQSVDAVLLTDVTTDIKLNDTVIIKADKRFKVTNKENVAEQNEVLVIALKRLD